ncbi:MAG: CHASE2 domain-containing protein [Nostocales cyanobacterium]|nr:MAG: CHASE2 domain-containing protein [Nostocales cyanobacterium]
MKVKVWGASWLHIRKYMRISILEQYLSNPYLLTTLLSMGLWTVGVWATLELLGFNILLQTRNYLPHANWDERIAVIGIDDATLREYGEFPLSRDRYTQLLETLEVSPPAAIGFDILFTEPSIYDTALAEAMEINGQVVLAVAASSQTKTLYPVPILDQVTAKGHIVSNADLDGVTRQSFLYINQYPALQW